MKHIEDKLGKDSLVFDKATNYRKMTLDRNEMGKSTGVAWVFLKDRVIVQKLLNLHQEVRFLLLTIIVFLKEKNLSIPNGLPLRR